MTTTATRVQLCVLDVLPAGLGRPFRVGNTPLAIFRTRTVAALWLMGCLPTIRWCARTTRSGSTPGLANATNLACVRSELIRSKLLMTQFTLRSEELPTCPLPRCPYLCHRLGSNFAPTALIEHFSAVY